MVSGSVGKVLTTISAGWIRGVNLTKIARGLEGLGDEDYQTANAIATRSLLSEWAHEICELWASREIDGCYRLLLEYRVSAFQRSNNHLYKEVKTKLGSDGERQRSLEANPTLPCEEATLLVLSVIQDQNDRAFLESIDGLIRRWQSTEW
jgi:hypothetical protein